MSDLSRAADRCVQCGFCLTACPTYRLFDNERSSPRGRIAIVKELLAGELEPSLSTLSTFSECLGCRACESACPSGVHYEEILIYGRQLLRAVGEPMPLPVRLLLDTIARPRLLTAAKRLWRRIGRVLIALARRLGRPHGPLALLAAVPEPARLHRPVSPGRAEVVVHPGCLMDIFWGRTNERAVELLRRAGRAAELLPESSGCCGALHGHQGDLDTARRLAQRLMEAFEASGASVLVNLAGGCSAFMKEYPSLFAAEDPWRARAERLASALKDMASLLSESGYRLKAPTGALTYQDSCHLRHGLKVWREPRAILRTGGNYRELPSAGQCCGSAGVYNMLRPDIANRILRAKLREVQELGAEVVVTSNPGCELQWRYGVRQAGLPVRVVHLVDLVYETGELPETSSQVAG